MPDDIISSHQNMILCMDVMHVNKIMFLITMSKHINFGTIKYIADRWGMTIAQATNQVAATYERKGVQCQEH